MNENNLGHSLECEMLDKETNKQTVKTAKNKTTRLIKKNMFKNQYAYR
jgi:hypothetical protein